MNTTVKYKASVPFEMGTKAWPSNRIAAAPVFAAVDMRDGNQAFAKPMDVETKLKYFDMLVKIGFPEIEVAYPAASQEDFELVRRLIDEKRIPHNVTISVLTAAIPALIERTFEAIEGAGNVICHCYIASSELHRRFVFGKSGGDVIRTAVEATRRIAGRKRPGLRYEFSPEEFSDTEIGYAVELCTRVKEAWGSCPKGEFILNLPATVERRPPYEFADMIEIFLNRYPYREETITSVHTHNDQGCAVAAAEMACLAGAERIEGTLFGHGERTGNMDIMTFALNLMSRGIETGLDFRTLPEITEFVAKASGIAPNPRHPYAGKLVFTAFSGTHQDAIRKGMAHRNEISRAFGQGWKMPYLHVDPADLGRDYKGLIRINSQSGKGGAAFVLEEEFGITLPKAILPEIGRVVQTEAEQRKSELSALDISEIFRKNFININTPCKLMNVKIQRPSPGRHDFTDVELHFDENGVETVCSGTGNGPIEAACAALQKRPGTPLFRIENFTEYALEKGAGAHALALVSIQSGTRNAWGAGIDCNVNLAAIQAVVSALNRLA